MAAGALRGQMPLLMHGEENGANGYLLFEKPQDDQNIELVDGTSLGNVLYETDVPVLVLNACRSAHADVSPTPDSPPPVGEGPGVRALRAFVESLGALGNYYHHEYGQGNRDVIGILRAEEPNLLRARQLALSGLRQSKGEMAGALIGTMQGLQTLYAHTGRRAEWKRLVEEIVPDFVGADDMPIPGREEQWSLVTQYRVLLAKESRDWAGAERLQRVCVEWDRRNAAGPRPAPGGVAGRGREKFPADAGGVC